MVTLLQALENPEILFNLKAIFQSFEKPNGNNTNRRFNKDWKNGDICMVIGILFLCQDGIWTQIVKNIDDINAEYESNINILKTVANEKATAIIKDTLFTIVYHQDNDVLSLVPL